MSENIEDRLRRAARDLQMTSPNTRPAVRPHAIAKPQHASVSSTQSGTNAPTNVPTPGKKPHVAKRRARTKLIVASGAVIVCLAVGLFAYHFVNRPTNPIPANIRQALSFDTYYPVQSKLPTGYSLNMQSFSASSQALIYVISISGGQQIVVSAQPKPQTNQIQSFYKDKLNDHRDTQTNVGAAAIGTVNNQTLVSLPTKTNAWLILTAPKDVDLAKLTSLLQSFRKS